MESDSGQPGELHELVESLALVIGADALADRVNGDQAAVDVDRESIGVGLLLSGAKRLDAGCV